MATENAAGNRIEQLLDAGSFVEIGGAVTARTTDFNMQEKKTPADGVITGYGVIDGNLVYVYSQDASVLKGSIGEMHARKIANIYDMAMKMGAPVIGLIDCAGLRLQEATDALEAFGSLYQKQALASGVIPQISAIMGPCAGGAVYSPALTDFILMVKNSGYMFITGPDVVRSVTQEEVTKEELGGVGVHMTKSGVAHLSAENDIECINYIRELISYLPGNNMEEPPFVATSDSPTRLTPELADLIPSNPNQPYNIKEMIEAVADDNSFFELQAEYAANIVTGYIRLNGKTVGVVANQPLVLAGTLDINASIKAARFVRFCDAFNIPLLTLVDVPGFLPGIDQEYGGIIRNGAKLLYAYCEATVPKVTVITRKAYGGAYDVMSSKHIRGDVNLAFPTAEIAVMGPDGAVNILFRKEIDKAEKPEEKRKELQDDYRGKFANPYRAAELGYVDEVIDPAVTRLRLIRSFEMLANKRQSNPPKKHSNLPL